MSSRRGGRRPAENGRDRVVGTGDLDGIVEATFANRTHVGEGTSWDTGHSSTHGASMQSKRPSLRSVLDRSVRKDSLR